MNDSEFFVSLQWPLQSAVRKCQQSDDCIYNRAVPAVALTIRTSNIHLLLSYRAIL